jgi:hypothetical protein
LPSLHSDEFLTLIFLAGGQSDGRLVHAVKTAVQNLLERRNLEFMEKVFNQHKEKGKGCILKENLGASLRDLCIYIDDEAIDEMFSNIDTDRDGKLDFDEFKAGVTRPSKIEQWTTSIPFSQLFASALTALIPSGSREDPVRLLADITKEDLSVLCAAVQEGLFTLLEQHILELKAAFYAVENMQVPSGNVAAGSKFSFDQLVEMSCGNIDDFFAGLGGRVGE